MKVLRSVNPKVATQIPSAPIARFLLADTRMAWFWLLVRLSVGVGWLAAGGSKLTGFAFGLRPNGPPWWFLADGGASVMLAGVMDPGLVMAVESLFLILAWRISGYYGVDRWLLPLLGTPWTGALTGWKTADKALKPSPLVP